MQPSSTGNLGILTSVLVALSLPTPAQGQREVWRQGVERGPAPAVTDDVDGDHVPDLLTIESSTTQRTLRLWSGLTGAQVQGGPGGYTVFFQGGIGTSFCLGAGDVDGDGRGDCLLTWTTGSYFGTQERIVQMLSLPSFAQLWERRYPELGYPSGGLRIGDADDDGSDDLCLYGPISSGTRSVIVSGRTGAEVATLTGYGGPALLWDVDGDEVRDFRLGTEVFSGADGRFLWSGVGHLIGVRNVRSQGLGDVIEVLPVELRRRDGFTGAVRWSIAPQGPAIAITAACASSLGDIDEDGFEDVLVIAEDASQRYRYQAYSGLDGHLIWSSSTTHESNNLWCYALHGVPGHFVRNESTQSTSSMVLYSLLSADTPLPLHCAPLSRDWRSGGVVEVSGVLPSVSEIRVGGIPLLAPTRLSPTKIRGVVSPIPAPGWSIVEAANGPHVFSLQAARFASGPALDCIVGGSASNGGFLRVELVGSPSRGAMLWISTGYAAAPIAVPPIAFHALTDPLVLIPIYFGATDATGRLELRVPFSADPYLSSAPMVMQAMALQAFPFDGSFTNAVDVIVPL